jgi:acyl carrier protein
LDIAAGAIVYSQTTGDSTAHMCLVMSIENRFDIMLEMQDVIDMSSFHKAQEILRKSGISFDA